MTTRFYSNLAPPTTLNASITNAAATMQIASAVGLPTFTPFTMVLDKDTASMELVEVTAVAGTTLDITRGIDGTSAQGHNSGAAVEHVSSARDFADSRTHENSTQGVHGLAGGVNVVGDTSTQTLTNKTMTAPTINVGSLNGTISGNPAFSGNVFLNNPQIVGADLQGTVTGSPAFTGTPDFQTGFDWGGTTISGAATLSGSNVATNQFRIQRTNASDQALVIGRTGATTHLMVNAEGDMSWSDGTNPPTVTLQRENTGGLLIDNDLRVTADIDASGNLNATGSAIIGGDLDVVGIGGVTRARKTSDTSRASVTTPFADPHLTVNLEANAVYQFTVQLFVASNTSGADIEVTFDGTAISTIQWAGIGAHNSMTTGSAAQGEWIARVGSLTPIPYAASQTAGVETSILLNGMVTTIGTFGSFNLNWSQQTSNATPTIVRTGSWMRCERVA